MGTHSIGKRKRNEQLILKPHDQEQLKLKLKPTQTTTTEQPKASQPPTQHKLNTAILYNNPQPTALPNNNHNKHHHITHLFTNIITQQTLSLDQLNPHDLHTLQATLCPPAHLQLKPLSLSIQLCNPTLRKPLHKRAFITTEHPLLPRQSTQGNGSGPSADGYPSCTAVSNAILSCFPESHTVLVQHTWSKFIWNNNYPTFIGSKNVDIYLYNANSENPVANWKDIPNDRGMIGIYADDSWFPSITSWQDGRNLTYPYFFIITTAGAVITGGEQHQATFRVIQTTPPASYISSSLASASYTSQLVASLSSQPSPSSTGTPNSNLQHGSSSDTFPRWEIALIVLLGSFALLIFLVAAYLAFTNARKRRQVRIWQAAALGGKSGSGGSVASHSPMIQNTEGAALIGHHQQTRGGGGGGGHHHQHISARDLHSPTSSRPGSPLSATHGPTTTFALPAEHQHHQHHGAGSEAALATPDGPITSVDATMMADAFRKALRKPEFALPEAVPAVPRPSSTNLPEQERIKSPLASSADPLHHPLHQHADELPVPLHARESMYAQVLSLDDAPPLHDDDDDDGDDGEEAKEIMDRELASEGRSMTSVDNRKRPQVHG
ncbi:hypothetical protein PCANC_18281 [Puccinia coronata f. sp. avenae]|uniref:Uncharacterized protein n=1 Tax=Puccinia coronata f. sp. avenae TaxID=200324 RepID=A0A2N5UFW3_9BASI|nr:hypothetical protein PCANC_18281 [Puccinia coronata f. sp. avenae]